MGSTSGYPITGSMGPLRSRASFDELDPSGWVMPMSVRADASRWEEENVESRRNQLRHELDERGICPVYDPHPAVGSYSSVQKDGAIDIATFELADMKSFVLGPAPRLAGMIECRIIRERAGIGRLFPSYTLETDSGVFLMCAKKQAHNKTSNYSISMSKVEQPSKAEHHDMLLGKLRSNFSGLEFTAYGTGLNPKNIDPHMSQVHAIQLARQEFASVQYSSSIWGAKPRGPRKMSVVIPLVQPVGERIVCRTLAPETEGLSVMAKAGHAGHFVDVYQNKPPKWNEQIGAFVLNFNKRVTQASVKNFQLTSKEDPDTVYLQFGRVGKDVFNMDFRHPFSAYQAFAICLSSFDYKLCCE